MNTIDDIMDYIASLGYGEVGKGIYSPLTLGIRKPSHGILVEQRASAPEPDALNHTDTIFFNVQVHGPNGGEKGEASANDTAFSLYSDLLLVLDTTINDTLYLSISADSAPYEIMTADGTADYVFGLQVVRYIGAD